MMVNLFPFLAVQSTIPNQEPVTGGIEFNRDSAPAKGVNSPFAGILQYQSAAASLLSFHPVTKSSGQQQSAPDFESSLHHPELTDDAKAQLSLSLPHSELAGEANAQLSLVTVLDETLNLYEEKPIPSPFPLKGEDGEGGNGDKKVPQEVFDPLPERFFSEIQVVTEGISSQAMVAGTSGGNDIHNPPFFTPFDQSLLSGRVSVPGSSAETKIPEPGLMTSVAHPNRQPPVSDVYKGGPSVTGSLEGKPSPESSADAGRNGAINLERTIRPLPDIESLLPRISPSLAQDTRGSLRPFNQQAFQPPPPIQENPTGMAEVAALDQYRMKPPNGLSSLFSIPSEQGKASSTALSSDFLRESSLSLTGEHTKNFSEATGKMMGVEQQAGQGLNTGLGGSPHSQNGFQQPSTHLPSGTGVRMAEDPMTEVPTPALQRLQLDVQLSETNRIHIDVGVQHRQVYAGLVMDQASLKNLAVQFVPQLEDQLAQADMELQEFSAEVRDHHREQERDSTPLLSEKRPGHREMTGHPHTPDIHSRIVRGMDERGLHLVA